MRILVNLFIALVLGLIFFVIIWGIGKIIVKIVHFSAARRKKPLDPQSEQMLHFVVVGLKLLLWIQVVPILVSTVGIASESIITILGALTVGVQSRPVAPVSRGELCHGRRADRHAAIRARGSRSTVRQVQRKGHADAVRVHCYPGAGWHFCVRLRLSGSSRLGSLAIGPFGAFSLACDKSQFELEARALRAVGLRAIVPRCLPTPRLFLAVVRMREPRVGLFHVGARRPSSVDTPTGRAVGAGGRACVQVLAQFESRTVADEQPLAVSSGAKCARPRRKHVVLRLVLLFHAPCLRLAHAACV